MNEIVSIKDWEFLNQTPKFLLLITKDSCKECRDVEKNLEQINNMIKQYEVVKIKLDNENSIDLINSLDWIKKEVDFVPFWYLFIDSERITSTRGDIEKVTEII